MTAAVERRGARPPRERPARVRRTGSPRAPLVDVLAPATVVLWMVLAFQPFSLLLTIPGAVLTLMFPAWCVGVLLITPPERVRRIPVQWTLVVLALVLAVSVVWSEIPGYTMYLIRSEIPGLLLMTAIAGTIPPRQVVRIVAVTATVIATWSLLISLAWVNAREAALEEAYLGAQQGFRGTFIHKNHLGMFMIFGLCALLVERRGSARRVALAIVMVTLLGTRSASVGGGLLAVAFVWLWISALEGQRDPRRRAFLLAMSVMTAVAGLLLVLGLLPTLLDLYDKDVTFSGRTFIWAESINAIRESPVHGYGLGGVWSDRASPVTAELHARIGFEAAHAHNGAIDLALQIGLVGLAVYLALVVQTARAAGRAIGRPETLAIGQWGVLTVASLLLMSVAENIFLGPFLGWMALVWVACTRATFDLDPTSARRRRLRARVATRSVRSGEREREPRPEPEPLSPA